MALVGGVVRYTRVRWGWAERRESLLFSSQGHDPIVFAVAAVCLTMSVAVRGGLSPATARVARRSDG